MSDNRIKEQLDILKSEQKAKSNKRKFVENYIKKNANRFEDKLTAVKITQKADQNLFANAIKELMKKNNYFKIKYFYLLKKIIYFDY